MLLKKTNKKLDITDNISMNFISFDLETANSDYSSICQFGAVEFENGEIAKEFLFLIDPEDDFNYINTQIHGISESDVASAPTFPEIHKSVTESFSNYIVVYYGHFDKSALEQACQKYNLPTPINTTWINVSRIARRVWKDEAKGKYGLKVISNILGITFKHHNALEDAIACGKIIVEALRKTNTNLQYWIDLFKGGHSSPIAMKRNNNNKTIEHSVIFDADISIVIKDNSFCFSGTSSYANRSQIKSLVLSNGGIWSSGITSKVSYLLVGNEGSELWSHGNYGNKIVKGLSLKSSGKNIKILHENVFWDSLYNE